MRYLITGGSGYIGSRLVDLLARREDTEKIVIADVVPPKGGYRPKTEYERVDVRDRAARPRGAAARRTRTSSCTSRSSSIRSTTRRSCTTST